VARTTDGERVLNLLAETQGLSNVRVRNELGLSDERYEEVRNALIEEGFVEKYACHSGGVRLTRRGEREITPEYEAASRVSREEELYDYVVEALSRDAPNDLIFDTASLRKRGKWQNPDVTQVSIEVFPRLRQRRTLITTYEVKQWPRFDVGGVFEAASHARFAHECYVIL